MVELAPYLIPIGYVTFKILHARHQHKQHLVQQDKANSIAYTTYISRFEEGYRPASLVPDAPASVLIEEKDVRLPPLDSYGLAVERRNQIRTQMLEDRLRKLLRRYIDD